MRVTLPSGTPAEVAEPPGSPHAGLVVIPDIMGLRPLFDDMCARLATEHGWRVCAVEPFPGQEYLALDERMATVGGLDDERLLGDVLAAADMTACDEVHVLGFCMGGMYTLKAAGTGRFARAVSFYGMIRLPEHWRGPKQSEPLDLLGGEAGRVLAIIGARDHLTPPDDVDALRAAGATVVVYPDAEHGFVHDPARPAHRADNAADAWRRAAAWLAFGGA